MRTSRGLATAPDREKGTDSGNANDRANTITNASAIGNPIVTGIKSRRKKKKERLMTALDATVEVLVEEAVAEKADVVILVKTIEHLENAWDFEETDVMQRRLRLRTFAGLPILVVCFSVVVTF